MAAQLRGAADAVTEVLWGDSVDDPDATDDPGSEADEKRLRSGLATRLAIPARRRRPSAVPGVRGPPPAEACRVA